MKNSTKLSDAMHILTYIAINPNHDLSSTQIAQSVNSNPVVIRRIMSQLKKANLLLSENGKATPSLAHDSHNISMLDVYHAVENEPTFLKIDDQTNPNCPIGSQIKTVLDTDYTSIQKKAEQEMATIALADVVNRIHLDKLS